MLTEISISLLFMPTHFNSPLKHYVQCRKKLLILLIKNEKEIKEYWMHISST